MVVNIDEKPTGNQPVEGTPPNAGSYYSEVKLEMHCGVPKLVYEREPGLPQLPEDMKKFRREIEDLERLVRMLFENDPQRLEDRFNQLQRVATDGLCGSDCNVQMGLDNITFVKQEIADEFPAVREKMWWWNLIILLSVAAICAVASGTLYAVTNTGYPVIGNGTSVWLSVKLAAFLIPLGAVIGLSQLQNVDCLRGRGAGFGWEGPLFLTVL